ILLYAILWILVVRITSISLFQIIIEDVLKKDITLSFRTEIWEKAFIVIQESLWYGHGINTVVLAGKTTYFAAHNFILQIILDSGLIGFGLFFICILIVGIRLDSNKVNKMSTLILVGLFGVLIGGIAESYQSNYLFILL